ncbi:MAG TPA: FtsX-like permease family protein [Candidatus Dormibacteraeota bacterium]|nr:FtsX-like permease family protein [Candidatus Dormibacteraeota bacterium]
MFWRVLERELRASRARLALALLVVLSGSAVVSAMLNLQLDIDGKLARMFRVFGANVVVTPAAGAGSLAVMDEAVWNRIAASRDPQIVGAAPYLYAVARIPSGSMDAIVAGTDLARARSLDSWWKINGNWPNAAGQALVGSRLARKLDLAPKSRFRVQYGGRSEDLVVAGLLTAGGHEDNQIFVNLRDAQQLAGLPRQISLVQISVAGSGHEIQTEISRLAVVLGGVSVRPIPEFTTGEAQLAEKIRSLVGATVGLILALTVLGVLASMAALATERRHDVGVMKAIGGPAPRIVRLFLAEVGLLAVGGALGGCALGFPISSWISQRAFGTSAGAEWQVVPLVAALMFGAALAGALPLRLLGRVRPAIILRGEGWSR